MNLKHILLSFLYLVSALLLVPFGITMLYTVVPPNQQTTTAKKEDISTLPDKPLTNVLVYNPDTEEQEPVPFENYLKGVVAAEMPASFEMEALKAQAVAARTYAIKHTDTAQIDAEKIEQAYVSVEEMKKNWGAQFDVYYSKISDAVDTTRGEILTYHEEPIEAVFHSTSAGITEASENVWSSELPYLTSVDSQEDENAPDFIVDTTIPKTKFWDTIKQKYPTMSGHSISIVARTKAGYVKTVQIGTIQVSGVAFRSMFHLRSSCFTITDKPDSFVIETKGYGHGAGMSQYGANFMAKEGKNYKEILTHYYNGVSISKS